MRRIVSAITVAALALSLVASATQANAAVAGYDSAYAGESAFLNLQPGQSGTFTVFFANTGSTSWVRGSGSQVDLAACLENKTTCNAQDATEAPFNSGWLSATRYTTQTQTTVAPGQIGTFTYNVAVPAGQAAGNYRFNGALVLASTGADIRNEGYYQDVTVSGPTAGAASITSITPTTGSTAGGTTVTITGSGFVCTPQTPTVTFDTSQGTVTSCGATTITATSPAHAAGAVNLTVTNAGAAASNAVTYVYADTTRPVYSSVTVAGNVATVTFTEAVCRTVAFAAGDWTATINGNPDVVTGDSIPACNATFSNGVTTANVFLTTTAPNGSFVAVTLETAGGADIRDAAGNTASAPRSNTTTATAPDTTRPTITSASGSGGSTTLTLNFSEPVWCGDAATTGPDAGDIAVTTGTTTILNTDADTCPTTAATAATSFTVTLASPLASSTSYSVTYTVGADETQDVTGNDLASPATSSFISGAQDTVVPTLTDTKATINTGTTDFGDAGDRFTVTFSEAMTVSSSATITGQDADATPTVGQITCGGNATCTLSTDKMTLTVTFTSDIAVLTAGTQARWQLPVTITATGGITDTAGNVPNLAGSADRVIDIEP